MRRLLWRKLAKVNINLKKAQTMQKWGLEEQLRVDFVAVNNTEEDEAVFRIKENPKAFLSFAQAIQNTKNKVGPFVDPTTGQPNSSPYYCCEALQFQYKSVFNPPRQEWKVENLTEHFKAGGGCIEITLRYTFLKLRHRESMSPAFCSSCKWAR